MPSTGTKTGMKETERLLTTRKGPQTVKTGKKKKKKKSPPGKIIIHNLLPCFPQERLSKPLVPFVRSPKPTLEEVRSWGQSFDKLMCCPAGRNSFRQFLRTEFSEENMLFWLACDEFRREANKSAVEENARAIYEDYISILSPKEVWLLLGP